MAKIPEAELQALKASVDLVALIQAKGVSLKPHGQKDLIGRCPFHDDREPSLVVTPSKGLWHCLGACQMGGSALDWVMKTEGVSFLHAVELLRQGKASSFLSRPDLVKRSTTPKLECPLDGEASDSELLDQVSTFYHQHLLQSSAAKTYLQKRGLWDEELVKRFRLGVSDRTLGLRLPEKNRQEGKRLRERLQSLGVLRASGHEHLAGSLVIPIRDDKGHTQNLYGRKLLDNLRAGTAYHLYLPRPHRELWNPEALAQKELILCESLIDALSFWRHGFHNVSCAYGVEGFSEAMLEKLLSSKVREVFLAFDRDEAGERGAERLMGRLQGEGLTCRKVLFPQGMDANSFTRSQREPREALKALLNGAEWRSQSVQVPGGERVDTETGELLVPEAAASSSLAAPAVPKAAPASNSILVDVPHQQKGESLHITLGERHYLVRGHRKNQSAEVMKVSLKVQVPSGAFYVDQLDLYHAKHRQGFIQGAAQEIGQEVLVIKRDVGRVLLLLEELHEKELQKKNEPEKPPVPPMSEKEREEALCFLKAPDLVSRILADCESLGLVGEDTNKLAAYLACISSKQEKPLGVLIQSSSAAGKSALMDAILRLMPEEAQVKYSAMTGQSLYYLGESGLKHKILAICEEEGAQKASYALKLLQSDGKLSIASTGKDAHTGRLVTQEYRVEGPVMLFVTTTRCDIDEELQNRCLILSVDESREQTEAIHQLQRLGETLEGVLQKRRGGRLARKHHNVFRLLRPLQVVNPFAPRLSFSSARPRTRRDHLKYLTFIRTVAFLHQYQRPVKQKEGMDYIEVRPSDIELAGRLCGEVLGRSLDELAPQTRKVLHKIEAFVEQKAHSGEMEPQDVRFTRRELREYTGVGHSQLAIHMQRLEEMEYLAAWRKGPTLHYELLVRCEGDKALAAGLSEASKYHYDADLPGVKGAFPGSFRATSGPFPEGIREGGRGVSINENRVSGTPGPVTALETTYADAHTHINGRIAANASHCRTEAVAVHGK